MDLYAHAVHAASHARWPELVLSEEPDGEGDSVEIHGEDEVYTITVNGEDSFEGGIDSWAVEDGTLTIELTGEASVALETQSPLVVEFDPVNDNSVAEVLEQLTGITNSA